MQARTRASPASPVAQSREISVPGGGQKAGQGVLHWPKLLGIGRTEQEAGETRKGDRDRQEGQREMRQDGETSGGDLVTGIQRHPKRGKEGKHERETDPEVAGGARVMEKVRERN